MTPLSVFLQSRGEQHKMPWLWSSDSVAFCIPPLGDRWQWRAALFKQTCCLCHCCLREGTARAHTPSPALTSTLVCVCTSVCVCMWMFEEGKVQRVSPGFVIIYWLRVAVTHPHPLGQVDSRQIRQAERNQVKEPKQARMFHSFMKHIKFRNLFQNVGLLRIAHHAILARSQVWRYSGITRSCSFECYKNSGELIRSKTEIHASVWEQRPVQSTNSYNHIGCFFFMRLR